MEDDEVDEGEEEERKVVWGESGSANDSQSLVIQVDLDIPFRLTNTRQG